MPWPVSGTLTIGPAGREDLSSLDDFVDATKAIVLDEDFVFVLRLSSLDITACPDG